MKVQTNLKAGQVTISIGANTTVNVTVNNTIMVNGNTITSTSTPAEG
jgi:hypothetical protein